MPLAVSDLKEYSTDQIKLEDNAKKVENNLKNILDDTITHNVDMMIVTCGYILSPYFVP